MARGDHIYVRSLLGAIPFQHHGIDMGDGTVIHLAAASGGRVALRDVSDTFSVRRDCWEEFCQGRVPQVVEHADAREPEDVAVQAENWLGKTGYNLLHGNCEHFATFCATGRCESHQIEMSEATVSAMASLATKAFWLTTGKIGGRLALRGATKVHPAAMLADGVEMVTLAVGCGRGLSANDSRRLAKVSGTLAAAGIGVIFGGPAGAAVCVAAHSGSGVVADRICKSVRDLLS